MIIRITELVPHYIDKKKSFYNKARVVNEDGVIKLASYNVIVAKVDLNGEVWITKEPRDLTTTTLRHIREFVYQYGGYTIDEAKALTKKSITA